jgi:acyl-CoA synthetase (AMP-forming)/AMP-acid ligase II
MAANVAPAPTPRAVCNHDSASAGRLPRASARPIMPPMTAPPCNIAARFERIARESPDQTAIVFPDRPGAARSGRVNVWTYQTLAARTNGCASKLVAWGVSRGMRVILMVRPGGDFFALTFALLRIGAVPVLIDPGMGRRNMAQCLAGVEAEAFIGVPMAHLFRRLHPAAFRRVRIAVTVNGRAWLGGHRLPPHVDRIGAAADATPVANADAHPIAQTTADDPAAILFTTGSTGPPKGAVYHHGVFDAQVRMLDDVFGFHRGEVDLATFPLFALFDAALGVTAVIPDMNPTRPGFANPDRLIETIASRRCTTMFGSPALLDRLSRRALETGARLSTIRRVLSAGAPVSADLLERCMRILPEGADVYTPYGATESLPVAVISGREVLRETANRTRRGEGVCVGRPMDGIDARIIGVRDEPIAAWNEDLCIPEGGVGEITVRGSVVSRAYFNNARATALAKIADAGDVWHRMGDLGWRDEQGRIWFCGRKSHRVRTAAGDLYTIPCEAVFNSLPGVRRTALVGVGAPGDQRPVLCVERATGEPGAPDAPNTNALLASLRARAAEFEHTRAIDTFLFHPRFPVDIRHNAKIFREQLAIWAARRVCR